MSAPSFHPGMRVVVTWGAWPELPGGWPIAGHYGKVTAVGSDECHDDVRVQVDITGHINGGPPSAIVREIGRVDWFYPDELDVVD